MTTLGHERGGSATVQHLAYEREFWDLVETARKHGRTADPLVRQQLAWAYTSVQLMRFSGLRTLAQVAAGPPPGPEASVTKLFWSEYHKRLGEIAMGIEGADGAAPAATATATRPPAGRTSSCAAGRAPSTPAPARSSATSSASGRSACPRSRGRRADGMPSPGHLRTRREGALPHARPAGPRSPGRSAGLGPGSPGPAQARSWSRRSGCGSSSRRAASRWSARRTPRAGRSSSPLPARRDRLLRAADPGAPGTRTVFGRPAVRSLRDLDRARRTWPSSWRPTHAVPDVIEDAAAAGVRDVDRARLGLPRGRRRRPGAGGPSSSTKPPRTASPCSGRTASGSSTPRAAGPVRADRAAAAAARPGRHRAAERRAGQRRAGLRPVAGIGVSIAGLDGQRGDDHAPPTCSTTWSTTSRPG